MLQDRAVQATGSSVTLAGILALALLLVPRAFEAASALCGPVRCTAGDRGSPSSRCSVAVAGLGSIRRRGFSPSSRQLASRPRSKRSDGCCSAPISTPIAAFRTDRCWNSHWQCGRPAKCWCALRSTVSNRSGMPSDWTMPMPWSVHVRTASRASEHRRSITLLPTSSPGFIRTRQTVAAALRQVQLEFRQPVGTSWGPVDVALTVGLENGDDASAPVLCIEHALSAIGNARLLGKNSPWHRTSEIQNRRHLSMMGELRQAMNQGDLRLAYQPKMALASGTTADCEALIRWVDGGQLISPDEFIPLAGSDCELSARSLPSR